MSERHGTNYYEKIIDVRELVNLQLRFKWYTIATTLLAAVAVFAISSFLITPQYQTSAFVAIIEPSINAELDPRVQVSPSIPDASSLSGLAEADEIIDEVIRELGYEDTYKGNIPDVEAALQGDSQLRLKVTTEDPVRSKEIANRWAEVLVSRLNDIFGTGELRLEEIEAEVNKARESWISAQEALESYLPQSRVDVLEVQLSEEKRRLNQYLNQIDANNRLIMDAQAYEARLAEKGPTNEITLGDTLSLIALQQRSSGGVQGTQLQLSSEQITDGRFTVSSALDIIDVLVRSVENQNEKLSENVNESENAIVKLTVELESEKHKLERLIQERDLARSSYQALASQLEETRITQSQDGKTAQIAAKALAPRRPSGPNTLINTAIAAVVGFLFSVSVVFIYDWYKEE